MSMSCTGRGARSSMARSDPQRSSASKSVTQVLLGRTNLAARIAGRKVIRFEHRSDLHFGRFGLRVGAPLYPVDRLLKVSDPPNPEPGDQVIRAGERARRHPTRRAVETNPCAHRTGLQTFSRPNDAGFCK